MFDIPIVIFTFRRKKIKEIFKVLEQVKPKKIYILSDQGRNDEEIKEVENIRNMIESLITWDCTIIKNYASENRGVYGNIALGSMWVFEREERAIFLEDDNLPEISFFKFCEEMLDKYENNDNILWICGTNYLGEYDSKYSYVFTQHLLPCGWASWSKKFLKYYDPNMKDFVNTEKLNSAKKRFVNRKLAKQYFYFWNEEYKRILQNSRPVSWDYQMDFCLKYHNLFGICPSKNQIKNIGVDAFSIHGGSDADFVMTKRFCGMESYPLEFPLVHPESIEIDRHFEKLIGNIMLYPLKLRFKNFFSYNIRRIFKIPGDISVTDYFKKKGKI